MWNSTFAKYFAGVFARASLFFPTLSSELPIMQYPGRAENMDWQEETLAVEEIKQIYEKLYGWTKQGERTDLTVLSDGTEKFKESTLSDGIDSRAPEAFS